MTSRTEAVREALEALYDGAGVDEAEALLDQLADRGFEVVERRQQETTA